MKSIYIFLVLFLGLSTAMNAQTFEQAVALHNINKDLPHKFKELRTGSTLEAVRITGAVVLYLLVDDIEQYDMVMVERSDPVQTNYSQCKTLIVKKGAYPKNYVELIDTYPLSVKMSNLYRIKTVTSEGITRMYAPVPITMAPEPTSETVNK